LVQWSTDVPLLVLVAARPELRDARSSLAAPGGLVNDVVTLTGLDAGAATRLAANVIGADELPAAVAGRGLATGEGNPLFVGEPALRCHHMLIRDAAYRRVLKNTRAELHGRFADWLESRVGEAVEHDETIGWHLEQAHRHLRELGPSDAQGRALGERAARYLAAAGRRALARDDLPLAAGLLGRALDRLDAADPARADLALDWCEALLAAGDVGPAQGAIAELGRFIGDSERLRAWHTCFTGQPA